MPFRMRQEGLQKRGVSGPPSSAHATWTAGHQMRRCSALPSARPQRGQQSWGGAPSRSSAAGGSTGRIASHRRTARGREAWA
eukprot:5571141-Alexandrium_andersonii.AAC.1